MRLQGLGLRGLGFRGQCIFLAETFLSPLSALATERQPTAEQAMEQQLNPSAAGVAGHALILQAGNSLLGQGAR